MTVVPKKSVLKNLKGKNKKGFHNEKYRNPFFEETHSDVKKSNCDTLVLTEHFVKVSVPKSIQIFIRRFCQNLNGGPPSNMKKFRKR